MPAADPCAIGANVDLPRLLHLLESSYFMASGEVMRYQMDADPAAVKTLLLYPRQPLKLLIGAVCIRLPFSSWI